MSSVLFKLRSAGILFSLMLCLPVATLAQFDDARHLHSGSVIVAARDYVDRVYGQSVILLTHYGPDGAAGIMLNRKTPLPVSEVLPASKLSSSLYLGGPVSNRAVLAIVQSASIAPQASQVLRDLIVISDQSLLEKTLAQPPAQFHVYLGHCEWGGGQLEGEVEDGGWYIFAGRSQEVFDEKPESLWARLITQTTSKLQFAGGILVHGDNHFIVRGPLPAWEVALALVRHWSLIQIGTTAPQFLRLKTPAKIGTRFDGWAVCWMGGWTEDRLSYLEPQIR
jgi:putative transcriptional regulator